MTTEPETDQDPNLTQGAWIGWLQIAAIAGVIVIAALITWRLSAGGGASEGNGAQRPPTPVHVIQPEAAEHQVTVSITGTVAATALVDLTPQVGGRIVEVAANARAGAAFDAGDVLFRIDPRDYEVAVTRARAALADADAALEQAEADAEIARREWEAVYPGRDITPLAAREPQLAAARARRLAAEADLAQARLNLERTEVAFPFPGRIVDSRLEAGLLAGAGQPYGSVYDFNTLEIVAPIAPSDLARLGDTTQLTAQVRLEGASRRFSASIAREGAQLDARTRFIDLFLDPGPARTALRPGQFAEISISGPVLENVFILPAEAVAGLNQVRIVEGGVIAERRVEVLDRSRGAVIAAPFDAGSGVIISPVPEGGVGREAEILAAAGGAAR